MENSEQLARVISEAVTNAIRRASTGTAGTVHANEQNNEVFYLFHRFTTFIIQIEAQGLFAYLNFVFIIRHCLNIHILIINIPLNTA